MGQPISAISSTHLVSVQLTLWTLMTYPVYKLAAPQGCVVRIHTLQGIALMVPFKQQCMLLFLKCWLLGVLHVAIPATRAPRVALNPGHYLSLPLMLAVWTFPVSPKVAASKSLLRCADIFAVIPVSCYGGCFGGKRVVLAQLPALTVWTVSAFGLTLYYCFPDMRTACWTVGA